MALIMFHALFEASPKGEDFVKQACTKKVEAVRSSSRQRTWNRKVN
jgi:hypothetical protein